MDREELKTLGLNGEQVEAVMKAHGKSVNDIKEKANRVDGLESQIDGLNEQIKDRDEQLTGLQEKAKDSKELTEEIDRLKQVNQDTKDDYQERMNKQAKDFAIENALRDAKAKNPKLAKGALDLDTISFKEGKLIGIDEQLKAVKESDSYLFDEEKPPGLKGRQPHEGGGGIQAPDKNPFSKEHFNLTEQGRLLKDEPELYKQLKAQAGL